MTIEVLALALVAGIALVLAARLDTRRSVGPGGPRPVSTDSALEAEQKRLADLKAELAAAETRTAEREWQISVKLRELTAAEHERSEAATELAKQEAALAQRERNLEWSLADAERAPRRRGRGSRRKRRSSRPGRPGYSSRRASWLTDTGRSPSASASW